MNFRTVYEKDLIEQRDLFSSLFLRVYQENFPSETLDACFAGERVDELYKFVGDGTAIVYGAFNENDDLIGFIWGYERILNNKKRVHVPILVVREGYERQGIAKILMQMMIETSKNKGIQTMEVMVTSSNTTALNYYDAVGFIEARKLLELRIDER